ncbi:MAG: nucleotidyltransferase family protein [Bifidobacteriaceae bacterium]|jgi:predicted nucleotidyltransferase|nr:nucleotidyltransferase family protein [Bifidobacteriaceae bacterium]
MSAPSQRTRSIRAVIAANRAALAEVLDRYGASNPRVFGSVARGDASLNSDVDLLVDLEPGGGNPLLRVAGIGEELSVILGVRVDVVEETLLRVPVSTTALRDAVAL